MTLPGAEKFFPVLRESTGLFCRRDGSAKATGPQCRMMDDFISPETNDDDDYVVVRVTEITRKPQTMAKGN